MSAIQDRPRVLVLRGGPDAERPVSLMSGKEVAEALRASGRYAVHDHIIDRPDVEALRAVIDEASADVVFPVLHGHWGEGGGLQTLLEEIGIRYIGSRPRPAARAMDKLVTKMLVSSLGIPTPPARQLMPDDECDLAPPLVLKPVDDGSSVDLRICLTTQQVTAARAALHPKRGRLMAERYVRGRELTVGIVRDEPQTIIEIIPSDAVTYYDYDAKYERDDTTYVLAPELPEGVADRCQRWAVETSRHLGCRDVARVDFMLGGGQPWFLEINTMPGFTTHSLVPMAARHQGVSMPELCGRLVDAALRRGPSPVPASSFS